MLFSRTRIKRNSHDSFADPLRTGAVPVDLRKMAGERTGGPYIWNGIFECDQKSPGARCDGAAGINWRAYTRAFEGVRSRRFAAHTESPAERSARDDFVVRPCARVAQANRRDV